jgi:azurin
MKKTMIVLGLVSAVAVSCSDQGNQQTAEAPVTTTESQPAEPKEEVTVVIKANDQMKFDLNEIRVPANSVVTLTLVNEGELPKAAMGHNFVLLAKGTDVADYALRAIQAGIAKEHIPSGNETIAYTKLLGGGESETITFDAPAAGEYDFICSFPGHYGMMKGRFIVG